VNYAVALLAQSARPNVAVLAKLVGRAPLHLDGGVAVEGLDASEVKSETQRYGDPCRMTWQSRP